jgi:hypothetical protein
MEHAVSCIVVVFVKGLSAACSGANGHGGLMATAAGDQKIREFRRSHIPEFFLLRNTDLESTGVRAF